MSESTPIPIDYLHEHAEDKINHIREQLVNYMNTNPLECLVIGISGGIDSTLVSALCEPILKSMGKRLHGYSLPIHSNKEDEISRALLVGDIFCDSFAEVNLMDSYEALFKQMIVTNASKIDHLQSTLQDSKMRKIMEGNVKARLRMIYLYNQARMYHGAVLSTDNMTEYLLGFWTLHGDVGDISPIQLYYKTEVYAMAEFLATEYHAKYTSDGDERDMKRAEAMRKCIHAVPTDGLGITTSDLDQIGAPDYETVDRILHGDKILSEKYPGVLDMMEKTSYKRNNPVLFNRLEVPSTITS